MRIASILAGVCAFAAALPLMACTPPGPSTEEQLNAAVKDATELRIERIPLVELEFKEEPLIDLSFEDDLAAEHVTLPVGITTYNQWQEGQELSRNGLGANIVIKGEFSEYVVRVNKKWMETHWLYLDEAGKPHEINEDAYKGAMKKLPQDNLKSVETVNSVVTFVLDEPVEQLKFTSVKPLTRYYVTVEIGNETFGGGLDKQLLDAFSKHQIELEVSKQTFEGGEVWDAELSSYTFFTTGRWQEIHGNIVARRTVVDNQFVEVTVPNGRRLVLPANEVK